jgi:hypothetical protein
MIWANVYYCLKQRAIVLLTLIFAFILSPVFCFAQTDPDNPCDGSDPFADCPLDTWVIVLAVIALIATTLYLYRKQNHHSKRIKDPADLYKPAGRIFQRCINIISIGLMQG